MPREVKEHKHFGVHTFNIDFNDAGKTTTILNYPVGTIIESVSLEVQTAFSAGATATVKIGSKNLINAFNLAAIGGTKSPYAVTVVDGATNFDITLSAATAGSGVLTVKIAKPSTEIVSY